MANKVTQNDILNINRIYLKLGTYAATAREVGFSAGTVKKYIIPDFIDPDELKIKQFSGEINPIQDINSLKNLLLSDEEISEIKELWEEIAI